VDNQKGTPEVSTSLLLCDDVSEIRDFIRKEVARHPDLEVVGEAATGTEAVEMAARLKPDLVVLDLSMPEMDGLEALALILEQTPGMHVVVLSGLGEPSLEMELLQRGASAFVPKGTPLVDLVASIREVAARARELRTDNASGGRDMESLQDMNDVLESRVRERTEELQAKTEELEAKTKELEASVAELESFAYSVSHDLRAPLRAMDGFSRILLDELGDQVPEDKREYLEFIRKNAQGMQELVDGLLSFSRLGRAALKREVLSPAILVRQALSDLGPEMEGSGVEVVVGDLPQCYADPTLLKQVFVNLISNAVKFSGRVPGGRVAVGAERHEDRTVYFVRDNGVGFDMAYADKIFGVFQRLHRAEDYEGTGIGLALVSRVIDRHGGRIWCESEVGNGATFLFTLPTEVGDGA
jgi:signal transduction histidine kinase